MVHKVFLVPGFFGFANLGDLAYWGHAQRFLEAEFARRGLKAEVYAVKTLPTASIRVRATRVLDTLAQAAQLHDGAALHLIGHSTGGLDARLMVTPDVALRQAREVEPWAKRVQSVITVSTPHYGAPMAAFFSSVMGQRILEALSLSTMYTVRFGGLPLAALLKLAGLLTSVDDKLGIRKTLVRQLFEQLLGDFTHERQREIKEFFSEVQGDQSLMVQLSPEGLDLFNAGITDRPGVRYGSVVTRATAPSVGTVVRMGLDANAQALHALYHAVHKLAGELPAGVKPYLTHQQQARLAHDLGALPTGRDNDGVVPTLSQPWGTLIQAVQADHLDVLGHFNDRSQAPPHYDWLVTGSGFKRRQFEALWRAVVDFLLGEDHGA